MIDTLPLLPDDKKKQFDSRYRVVLIAAQRAKHIMQGIKNIQISKYTKETSMALEEVSQGHVDYLIGKDACQALRDEGQSGQRDFDKSLLVEGDEDSKEIKKQLSVYVDDSPEKAKESDSEG